MPVRVKRRSLFQGDQFVDTFPEMAEAGAWARERRSVMLRSMACAAAVVLGTAAVVLAVRHTDRPSAPVSAAQGSGSEGWSRSKARALSQVTVRDSHRAASMQRLVAQDIPSSGNASVVQDRDPPNFCTIVGSVVSVSPRKFFCALPAHRTETCSTCNGSANCLSPEAALHNLGEAKSSRAFVGWNPQGGGQNDQGQAVTVKLPGSGEAVRALLWANSGVPEHDPEYIKIWSSHDGEYFQLRDVLDVRHLQGNSDLTVLPLKGAAWMRNNVSETLPGNLDSRSQTRAKYWRINPGPGAPTGPDRIRLQSIPRSMGLCSTVDCTNCGAPRRFFNWASDQADSTYSRWIYRQPPVLS